MPDEMTITLSPAPPVGTGGDSFLPVGSGYHLLRVLGRGQFGEVWHATAAGGVEVAVKIITRPLKEDETQRELKVLERLRLLRNSYLIGLQAFYQFNDRLFIVQEYADGGDLGKRLEACRRAGLPGIPPDELLRYMEEAAEALDYLHENQLHHRDIKPVNLLLLGRHVKVADFGLARVLETQAAQTMSRAPCTPAYTPPETFDYKLHLHSDQYSLACSYVELRTGHLPFVFTNLMEAMAAHVRAQPDLTSLGETEQQVLLRALAKEPDRRYPSCTAFVRALAEALRTNEPPRELSNTLGMRFVLVRRGTFWMGSPPDEEGRSANEGQKEATLPNDFYLSMYPVTQEQWQAVMGRNPSFFSHAGAGQNAVKNLTDDDLKQFPVECVSWEDVRAFLKRLNERERSRAGGWTYRLPTEAEWEYACRGGPHAAAAGQKTAPFSFAEPTFALASGQANFDANSPYGGADKGPYLQRTTKVGSYGPNALGLYDLHGNVWEWCEDRYESGPERVVRGGSWYHPGRSCRAAARRKQAPTYRNPTLGFRLVLLPSGGR